MYVYDYDDYDYDYDYDLLLLLLLLLQRDGHKVTNVCPSLWREQT